MKEWVIWGARGHAAVVADLVSILGGSPVACFDNDQDAPDSVMGIRNMGGLRQFKAWMRREAPAGLYGAVAIGGHGGQDRRSILALFSEIGIMTPPLVHPSAHVALSASLGSGSQVLAMAHVGVRVRVGSGCIINSGASVDHDVVLNDGVHIAPGVTLCGEVSVGRDAFVGAGSTVLPRLAIADEAGIGAGSTVTKSVDRATWVWGSPASIRQMARDRKGGSE